MKIEQNDALIRRAVIEKRWQKIFLEHERWLKNHEVRLRLHYKLVR